MRAGRRNYIRKGSGLSKVGLVLEEKTLRGLSRRLSRRNRLRVEQALCGIGREDLEGFIRWPSKRYIKEASGTSELGCRVYWRGLSRRLNRRRGSGSSELCMVGARGFEPPTPASRTQCATGLRYAPTKSTELQSE